MKKRKRIPITISALTVLLVVLLALSIGNASLLRTPHTHIVVRRGALELGFSDHTVRAVGRDSWSISTRSGIADITTRELPRSSWYPTMRTGGGIAKYGGESRNLSVTTVTIPLVLPTALSILLAVWLWIPHLRRRPRPMHFATCDYDLTGNTSGRCPECGQPVNRSVQE